MEPKKTQQASLSNKTALFFNIGLVITLIIVNMAFTHKVYDANDVIDLGDKNSSFDDTIDIPITDQPQPQPPVIKVQKITEVIDEEIIEDIDLDLDSEISDEINEIIIATPEPEKEKIGDEIFILVEENAAFEGGLSAFYKYVGDKMKGKYPAQARRMQIQGKVYVQFVINKDGTIQDVTVIKGIGAGCDELAMKVIQESPKWKPGKQRGNAVRQRMVIPVFFQLN